MALFTRKAQAGTENGVGNERASSRSARVPADPALDQKKRARRRLIGALALVIGAIIFVPMFFDSKPNPLSRDIAIQIPDKKVTAPPKTAAVATPTPALPPKAVPAEIPPVSAPSVPAPASLPSPPSPAVKEKETPPPLKIEPRVAPAAALPKPAVHSSEAQRVRGILSGQNVQAKTEGFVVQLGAYASQEKADETRRKLTQAGWKSFIEATSTAEGTRIRVRTGPYATREAAEKARQKLKALGFEAALVGA